jgi:hypothetical protein
MAYSAELDGDLIARQVAGCALAKASRQRAQAPRWPTGCRGSDGDARGSGEALRVAGEATPRGGRRKGAAAGEAATFEALKKKERTPENLAAAIKVIEDAFLQQHPVTTEQLEALGKARAHPSRKRCLAVARSTPGAYS